MEEEKYNYLNHFNYHKFTEYAYNNLNENIQVILYSLISFGLPFFLGHPQWLVGTLVNMMLVLGAQNLKGTKLFAMIFMPSLGVVSAGILFENLTQYLIYFIPMIWIGNIILVYGYKYMRHHYKLNKINSIALSIFGKVLLLSLTAYFLVVFGLVPNVFLYAMSGLQLLTAVIGSSLAFASTKFVLSRFAKPE